MIRALILALFVVATPALATNLDMGVVGTFTIAAGAKSVPIDVQATDDSGDAGISQKLFINGALKATATGGTFSYRWNVLKLKAGTYTVRVEVNDAAGNKTTATLVGTKQ